LNSGISKSPAERARLYTRVKIFEEDLLLMQ
jgi:hypothetical protein